MEAYYKNLSIEDIPGEIWKDISGYEGLYQVSNYGRVKGLERQVRSSTSKTGYRTIKAIILQQQTPNYEHRVSLAKDNKHKAFYVYILVAQAFIPNPFNKKFVKLIVPIENGGNTAADNLQWCENNSYNITNRKPRTADKKPRKPRATNKKSNSETINIYDIWVWPEGTPVWERRISKKKLMLAQLSNNEKDHLSQS